jgi:transposase
MCSVIAMENQFQIPLDLPDVRIIEVNQSEKGWLIQVESTLNGTTCRKCGREISDFHGYDAPIQLRHLPLFEVPVWIELRPKRIETEVNWDEFEQIEVIGIDEISLKRGHRHFVAIVTTKTAQGVQVLGVLADRKQATVELFLGQIPDHLKETIKTVCTDMHDGYVNAVQTQLPKARIVVDRFHVAQAYRNCADTVRKQELKRLKQDLPKAEYEQLKGVMWPFRKRSQDLSKAEKTRLTRLFVYAPLVEQAYTLREELTDIFEQPQTKVGAKNAIQAWCQRVRKRGITAFEPFLTTLDNWLDEITNYFLERHTSGFVEGFNNRIKVLKRRCYGIFDVKHIFQRLTLDLHGYDRFASTWIATFPGNA